MPSVILQWYCKVHILGNRANKRNMYLWKLFHKFLGGILCKKIKERVKKVVSSNTLKRADGLHLGDVKKYFSKIHVARYTMKSMISGAPHPSPGTPLGTPRFWGQAAVVKPQPRSPGPDEVSAPHLENMHKKDF